MFNVLQPEGWAPAKGYANGIEARGRMVFVAGMIGWNGQAQFETDDFIAQCRQALQNIVDTLACAGAGPQHMARMTWYVKDKKEYLARGRMVFVAGMIGWNGQAQFETDDFVAQCRQALQNIVDTLACAGAGPQHMARMTWYVKDKKEYLARGRELGKVYQEVIGKNYPAMTLVQVADLVEDRALVEIEVTAVVPD